MNARSPIICSLVCLMSFALGCGGPTLIGPVHASGGYEPALPTPEMFGASTLTAPDAGSLITVAGVRVRSPSVVLVDFVVLSVSDADCQATARALERLAQRGESPPYASLASGDGGSISMTNWRSALLKRNPEVGAFAVIHAAAIANPGDSMGVHRRTVTFSYETNGTSTWSGTVIARINDDRLRLALQGLDWMSSFHPESVRIDAAPRSVANIMIPQER